ncbi:MAG TPA: acetamidase [Lachnospiraceae bacterium]|nr:acetamidase [Lachnospiraceae bacterium]
MIDIRQDGNFTYVFSKYIDPIIRVPQDEEILIHTQDFAEGQINSVDSVPSDFMKGYLNPQTGPIYIEGAEPGDTLAIEIIDIQPDRDWAVSCNIKEFGGLVATNATHLLNKPLDEKVWIYRLQEDGSFLCDSNPKMHYPWEPFMGTIATAPEYEALSALTPFNQGGNMDCHDTCPGNTLYLPVAVEGAMFYTGDCHAKQGDGELIGTALEIAGKLTVKFHVIKNKKINWPRIENEEYIMVVGSARPMEDAARIAYTELVHWMVDEYGWDELDAYDALGQVGEMYVGNMCDTNYSLVAKVKKKYL